MGDEKHSEILLKLASDLNSPTCTAALKAVAPTPPPESLELNRATNRTHCSPEWEGEAPSIGGSLVCPSIPIAEFDSTQRTLGSCNNLTVLYSITCQSCKHACPSNNHATNNHATNNHATNNHATIHVDTFMLTLVRMTARCKLARFPAVSLVATEADGIFLTNRTEQNVMVTHGELAGFYLGSFDNVGKGQGCSVSGRNKFLNPCFEQLPGEARAGCKDSLPWLVQKDSAWVTHVADDGCKTTMPIAQLMCNCVSTRGVTELSVVDHQVTAKQQARSACDVSLYFDESHCHCNSV